MSSYNNKQDREKKIKNHQTLKLKQLWKCAIKKKPKKLGTSCYFQN